MYGGDEVSAIVLDVGSNTCKGGYAGEDTPKVRDFMILRLVSVRTRPAIIAYQKGISY